jgi:hypothetical protein
MEIIDEVQVTIKNLVPRILDYSQDLKDYGHEEGDIRLQIVDGWDLVHTGDASFDTDHRGYWGSELVPSNCTKAQAKDIAKSLIEQAANHFAECQA